MIDNKLYIIGGHNDKKVFNDVWIFDPMKLSWSQGKDMYTTRQGHTGVEYVFFLFL